MVAVVVGPNRESPARLLHGNPTAEEIADDEPDASAECDPKRQENPNRKHGVILLAHPPGEAEPHGGIVPPRRAALAFGAAVAVPCPLIMQSVLRCVDAGAKSA